MHLLQRNADTLDDEDTFDEIIRERMAGTSSLRDEYLEKGSETTKNTKSGKHLWCQGGAPVQTVLSDRDANSAIDETTLSVLFQYHTYKNLLRARRQSILKRKVCEWTCFFFSVFTAKSYNFFLNAEKWGLTDYTYISRQVPWRGRGDWCPQV